MTLEEFIAANPTLTKTRPMTLNEYRARMRYRIPLEEREQLESGVLYIPVTNIQQRRWTMNARLMVVFEKATAADRPESQRCFSLFVALGKLRRSASLRESGAVAASRSN